MSCCCLKNDSSTWSLTFSVWFYDRALELLASIKTMPLRFLSLSHLVIFFMYLNNMNIAAVLFFFNFSIYDAAVESHYPWGGEVRGHWPSVPAVQSGAGTSGPIWWFQQVGCDSPWISHITHGSCIHITNAFDIIKTNKMQVERQIREHGLWQSFPVTVYKIPQPFVIFIRTTALRNIQFAARVYFECLCSATFQCMNCCKGYTMTWSLIQHQNHLLDGKVLALWMLYRQSEAQTLANQEYSYMVVSLVLRRCPLNRRFLTNRICFTAANSLLSNFTRIFFSYLPA